MEKSEFENYTQQLRQKVDQEISGWDTLFCTLPKVRDATEENDKLHTGTSGTVRTYEVDLMDFFWDQYDSHSPKIIIDLYINQQASINFKEGDGQIPPAIKELCQNITNKYGTEIEKKTFTWQNAYDELSKMFKEIMEMKLFP